jgi:hypothetical protein
MKTQITICGGGNAAHTLIGILSARQDLSVKVFAPFGNEAQLLKMSIEENHGLTVTTLTGLLQGQPQVISNNPRTAIEGSEIVLLALPAFAHESILKQIADYIMPGAWVGALPSRGGFDLCAYEIFQERLPEFSIFGFQTLPWACRIQEFGKEVSILGVKEEVDLAALPGEMAPTISTRLQELLGVSINPVGNFLGLALADTGQIIHPGIMYGLFHEWNGKPFEKPKLFYQGVTAEIAEILQLMSDEIQKLSTRLLDIYPKLDLDYVHPVDDWLKRSYKKTITDGSNLQSCFSTNKSYAGLMAPMQKTDSGFIPDFNARYLSEDIPYNLLVTRGIAELAEVSMPTIDEILSWAQVKLDKEYIKNGKIQGLDLTYTRSPQRYGFKTLPQYIRSMQSINSIPAYL